MVLLYLHVFNGHCANYFIKYLSTNHKSQNLKYNTRISWRERERELAFDVQLLGSCKNLYMYTK